MADRDGLFAGDDPFDICRRWLAEAEGTEPNDPNAIALATVDPDGLPDVRMVLLKEIEGQGTDGGFVFYTNYESAKACQIEASRKAAFVMHWKSLRRQIRVRGDVTRVEGEQADAYYNSRASRSRWKAAPPWWPRSPGWGCATERARRAQTFGGDTALRLSRSNSGRMAHSACMTGSAGTRPPTARGMFSGCPPKDLTD